MKRPIFLVAVAAFAASTLLGTVAMADSHDRGRDQRHRDDHHDARGHDNDRNWDRHDSRHDYRAPDARGRYKVVRYYPPQGYRHYTWHRGARLPAAYYAPRYVVHNYDVYRLRAPPRGYHWVRVDNDVVLAALATGVVMQVVNGIFY